MMKTCMAGAVAAVALIGWTPAASALGIGTQNEITITDFAEAFEVFATGEVDIESGFGGEIIGYDHVFKGSFGVLGVVDNDDNLSSTTTFGLAESGSFIITVPEALEPASDVVALDAVEPLVFLSGDLVGGSVSYTSAFIEDDGEEGSVEILLIDGMLEFANLQSDVFDPADIADDGGSLFADIFNDDGPGGPGGPGDVLDLVLQQSLTGPTSTEGFVDYGEFDFEPPSSEVPVPAALPLLATGLGVIGWMRSRRKAA